MQNPYKPNMIPVFILTGVLIVSAAPIVIYHLIDLFFKTYGG